MTLNDFKAAVEAGIVDWLQKEKQAAPTEEAALLLHRMQALIMRGGKRARPQLLYMTYLAYGGRSPEQLLDVGLALEFHHQFLLIHDDIIDSDTVRYNGPNIVGYYLQSGLSDVQNLSQAMGLLAGDLLFSFSHQAILISEKLTDSQKVNLLKMLNDTNLEVAYGQQLDAYNVNPDTASFSEDKLLLTHALKCSSYTTQLPMQCAASLLNIDTAERQKIDTFATSFGLLFQLVDDYSDYFVNGSALNKGAKCRDFRQGKITYPLVYALRTASPVDVAFIKHNLGNKGLSDTSAHQILDVLERCGAKEASRKYVARYFERSRKLLDTLAINAAGKQSFTDLIHGYKI